MLLALLLSRNTTVVIFLERTIVQLAEVLVSFYSAKEQRWMGFPHLYALAQNFIFLAKPQKMNWKPLKPNSDS